MSSEDPAQHPGTMALAGAMEDRRRYLGLSLSDIQRLGGPERTTWRRVVRRESVPRDDTLAAVDAVLCWPEGTAKDILDLKRAVPTDSEWLELTEKRRRNIIRAQLLQLRKEQDREHKSKATQRQILDDLLNIMDQH